MTVNGRTVILTELFMTQLAEIQTYISEQSLNRGRQLTTNLVNFLLDTVAPNPFIFIEYAGKQTPEKIYRRAIFQRNYIIIYKVTETEIIFLVVYHASRNPDSISLDE